jgi:hypothetical protein
MILSQRERYLLGATIIALVILAAYYYVLTPLWDQWYNLADRRDQLQAKTEQAGLVLSRAARIAPKWKEMQEAGLKADPAEAESRVLHAIRDWAADAGLSLSLLKPDRSAGKTVLPVISFQAAGTGPMSAVSKFLWRVENADMPLRVTEVQLASRKEGTDNLSVQLRLSTLYVPGEASSAALADSRTQEKGTRE